MADSVGIRLGVDGEKAFKASLAAVNSQLKSLGAEMLAVTASFTKNADSQEALAAKNTVLGKSIDMQKSKVDLLNKQIEAQKGKLDALGSALDKASAEYGENSDQALKAQNAYNRQAKTVGDLTAQLHKAEAELSGMSAAMEDNNDALAGGGKSMEDLADGARNAAGGLEDAGKAGLSFGDIIKANVISDAVIGGIRALGEAMKTVASAAIDLVKDSVAGFSSMSSWRAASRRCSARRPRPWMNTPSLLENQRKRWRGSMRSFSPPSRRYLTTRTRRFRARDCPPTSTWRP